MMMILNLQSHTDRTGCTVRVRVRERYPVPLVPVRVLYQVPHSVRTLRTNETPAIHRTPALSSLWIKNTPLTRSATPHNTE